MQYTFLAILLMAGVICCCHTLAAARQIQQQGACPVLCLTAPVSAREIADIRESDNIRESTIPFTAWTQQNEVTVTAKETGRPIQLSCLWLNGDASNLLKQASVPTGAEQNTCAIDVETAVLLFGSSHAEGNTLVIGDEEYLVKQIITGVSNTIFLTDTRKEKTYDRISVSATDPALLHQFMAEHQWNGELVFTGNAWYTFCRFIGLLPLILIGLLPVSLFFRQQLPTASRLFLSACWLVLFFRLLDPGLAIPTRLIPTRWSDFSFWADRWKDYNEQLLAWIQMEKYTPDMWMAKKLIQALPAGLIGTLCIPLFMRCSIAAGKTASRTDDLTRLFIREIGICLMIFLAFGYSGRLTGRWMYEKRIWLIPFCDSIVYLLTFADCRCLIPNRLRRQQH